MKMAFFKIIELCIISVVTEISFYNLGKKQIKQTVQNYMRLSLAVSRLNGQFYTSSGLICKFSKLYLTKKRIHIIL